MVPVQAPVSSDVDFSRLALDYETFTGGTIRNVILRAAFEAACSNGHQVITDEIIRRCAEQEQPLRKKERQIIGFGSSGTGR